jgi:acyl dehydratase
MGAAAVPVRPGDLIARREIVLTRADSVRYAGASGDFNPIHWSEAAAEAAGLPGVIAHGMATMGRAAQVLVDWAGDPGAVLEFEVRFARPVPVPEVAGARLTVSGRVVAVKDGVATVDLDVTLDGAKVLGKARARVRVA